MAKSKFSRLPGDRPVIEANGQDLKISTDMIAAIDDSGTVESGMPWQRFVVQSPVAVGGDLKLKGVAVAALDRQWKSKIDQMAEWPEAEFTLDTQDGWNVTYLCRRLLIDSWALTASLTGEGYEETLELRAFHVERRRNAQHVSTMDRTGAPENQNAN